ncbi:MAG: hypothetical protein A2Y86_08450 [Candidatus Aminicenantes bacterium RBG_13_62_12]|nr:MAG: hypothetical protein A2Y86_08450 [Candidatus Aminicenantes bacterium RBG_13_62_12]
MMNRKKMRQYHIKNPAISQLHAAGFPTSTAFLRRRFQNPLRSFPQPEGAGAPRAYKRPFRARVIECGDASAADPSEDAIELSPNSLGEPEGLIFYLL